MSADGGFTTAGHADESNDQGQPAALADAPRTTRTVTLDDVPLTGEAKFTTTKPSLATTSKL